MSATIGAEIPGVDLTTDLADEVIDDDHDYQVSVSRYFGFDQG